LEFGWLLRLHLELHWSYSTYNTDTYGSSKSGGRGGRAPGAMSDLESSPPTHSSASSHDPSDASSASSSGFANHSRFNEESKRRNSRGKSVTKIILSSGSSDVAVMSSNETALGPGGVPLGAGLDDDLSLLDLSSMPAIPPHSMAMTDSEAGPDVADDEFRPANTDIFKDPSAFDFLSQHGQKVPGGTSAAAALARESLYRKFDPLIQGRQSIMPPKEQRVDDEDTNHRESENLIAMNSPDAKSSSTVSSGRQHINSQNQQQTPSSNSPLNSILHHQQTNQQLGQSCDSNNLKNNNSNHTNDNEDMDEEEEEERAHVAQLSKKDAQIGQMDGMVRSVEDEMRRIRGEVKQRQESEEQMRQVLKEYEKTISELISDKEKSKSRFEAEREGLLGERDQSVTDLRNVEAAFADVHRKYERAKTVVEGFRQNEETLKKCLEESRLELMRQEEKYDRLRRHAEDTLEKANAEIDSVSGSHEAETARLTAMLKKTEMKVASLERSVEQKVKENEELTAICDELIAKVGAQ